MLPCRTIREYRNQIDDIQTERNYLTSLGGNAACDAMLIEDIAECEMQIAYLESLVEVGVN